MILMDFHDYVCSLSGDIESSIITNIIQLLRDHFGMKHHLSG